MTKENNAEVMDTFRTAEQEDAVRLKGYNGPDMGIFEDFEGMDSGINTAPASEAVEGPLPIDDETNRRGEVVFTHENGTIRKGRHMKHEYDVFYAWPNNQRRGFRKNTFEDAAKFLGMRIPMGYVDYQGTQRAGRMIDRNENGEIWKALFGTSTLGTEDYYVWRNGAAVAELALNLTDARRMLSIDTTNLKAAKTPPKSSHPQNGKGYKAGSK